MIILNSLLGKLQIFIFLGLVAGQLLYSFDGVMFP